MKTIKRYQLGDRVSLEERQQFGLSFKEANRPSYCRASKDGFYLRAIKTDSFREPKKGEWYLSGAIPKAYKAPNDLGIRFRIMKLTKVKKETIVKWFEY